MKKEVKCAWCGEIVTEPQLKHIKNDFGQVVERRCPKCGKVIAAYLEQEGEFLKDMRTF